MAIQPINSAPLSGIEIAHKSSVDASQAAKPAAAPVETAAAVQQPDTIPSMRALENAVKDLNKAMQAQSQSLEFSIDTDTDRTIVKVVDQQTKEVLRQIPSEEVLQISKALSQVTGLLIRQKA